MKLVMPDEKAKVAEVTAAQTVFAVDFGTQKFGLAVGQSITGSATPLGLFPVRDGIPDWPKLLKLMTEWRPSQVLVGLPLNMDDTESPMSLRARKFARRLKAQTAYAVWLVDERLSTREARERLSTREARERLGADAQRQADAEAACILIESWFREPAGIEVS